MVSVNVSCIGYIHICTVSSILYTSAKPRPDLCVGNDQRDRRQEALGAPCTVRFIGDAEQQPAGPHDDPEPPFRGVQLEAEPREEFDDERAVPDTLGRLGQQLHGRFRHGSSLMYDSGKRHCTKTKAKRMPLPDLDALRRESMRQVAEAVSDVAMVEGL